MEKIMELAHIPLDQLTISSQNMRHSAKPPVISDILPSIEKLGIQQPLLVRKNGEGFEIVAGRRRYFSLMEIAKNDKSDKKVADVPCAIMAAGDDVAALEASLIENVARVDPDLMSRYETFTKLEKQGKTVTDIAETFGVTEIMVKRSLAIGNLIPALKKKFKADEIDIKTIRLLTLATKKKQREWVKLEKTDEEPGDWVLKEWLFGGELELGNALFPVEAYNGQIVTDLFGEEGYFDNSDKFWKLQNQQIAEKRDEYIKAGWDDVIILDIGKRFSTWDFVKTAKKYGGRIYVEAHESGEVAFHEGYITEKEHKARERKLSGTIDKTSSIVKPELTAASHNYIALHRHVAVRAKLLSNHNMAFCLFVAHAIGSSGHWSVKPDYQKADKPETEQSIAESIGQIEFLEERDAILKLLGWEIDESNEHICGFNYQSAALILPKLLKMPAEDVMRILTFVMAETLAADSVMVEMLASLLDVNMKDYWQPEETYFNLIRDKRAINGMLEHIGGEYVAKSNISSTAKIQKGIINDFLTGNGREQNVDWMPKHWNVPIDSYTKDGLGNLTKDSERAEKLLKRL